MVAIVTIIEDFKQSFSDCFGCINDMGNRADELGVDVDAADGSDDAKCNLSSERFLLAFGFDFLLINFIRSLALLWA